MSASAPGSEIERTKAAMRPSSPRSSRISSTVARYSRSSSRMLPSADSPSGRSSTSTKRRPCASLVAAPATPRWRPFSATARPPPGSRMRSVTSATVPTFAYSSSCLGTSSTRSSSPTSTVRVTFMLGKTTMSSRGTRRRRIEFSLTVLAFVRMSNAVVGSETVPPAAGAASSSAFDAAEPLQRSRRDPAREHVRGHADSTRAPRHHARDEDAAAPEDEP